MRMTKDAIQGPSGSAQPEREPPGARRSHGSPPKKKFRGPGLGDAPSLESCKQALRLIRAKFMAGTEDLDAERDLHEILGDWYPVGEGMETLRGRIVHLAGTPQNVNVPEGAIVSSEDLRDFLVKWRRDNDDVYQAEMERRAMRGEAMREEQIAKAMETHKKARRNRPW